MAGYYYMPRKTRGIFSPASKDPFALSRSKIDLFVECPRCFYLDRRIGVGRVPGYPFNLNSAVDELLKKEFDIHRAKGETHPMMTHYGIDAVPFSHKALEEWRDTFKGIRCHHAATNFSVFGGVDDVWVNPQGELHVIDYKATSKTEEVTLDAEWQDSYKRQVEVYQWLLRQNGFKVSNTAYFVYANGKRDREAFRGKLEFDVKIISYVGSDDWIEETLIKMKECLVGDSMPACGINCDWCKYIGEMVKEWNKIEKGTAPEKQIEKPKAQPRFSHHPETLFDTL